MSSIIVPIIGSGIIFVLYLALAAALMRKYQRTRDVGFVWLGVAAVLWPFLANVARWGMALFMQHSSHGQLIAVAGGNPVGLFDLLERGVELLLLLLAVFCLSKKQSDLPPVV
ncbi:MAG: hypothetical protein WA419_21655 [Silvibacterium sp.]